MALKRAAFSILVTMVAAAIVHVDTKTSCRLCQPGYHMVRKCKDKQPNTTRCARCPASSYTDLPNMEKGCYPHRKCNATSEVMVFPGNATHDVICEPCDETNHPCQPSQECPPGKGVKITGGCGICIYGYFSNESSSTQPCRPWTRCHTLGLVTIKEGNSTADVICGDPRDTDLSIEKAIHTSEDDSIKLEERKWLIINTVLTALILMIVLGFLVFIRSREECRQRTYEEEGHVALPVQCEDTHPKEIEASSSVGSRWSAATRLLPDQSTTVTRLSS
ncbi:tumor necrosis factor receptor superfamily member 5-like [Branchiostoma floridae]|uniref:Tumor necrosis factor receptor superfamily member 5-like n=1 Tax=Branchiostoma floridae TaxID=7739 RepID=A0A9J7HSC4_BRAFL|nr:tumor necrosis factor receptor superfamily member 5-like [Branchiostoma floridae]